MDRIRTLYQSLTKSERRYLKTHIQVFSGKGDNKAAQFLRLLEKKADYDNADMAKQLYGDPRSKAFIMLKRRLTERILDVMSNAASLSNNTKLNEDAVLLKNIVMYKMLVHAKILKFRGLTELSRETLEKCLELATETGYTEVQLQALAALRVLSPSYERLVNYYNPAIEEALQGYRTDLQGLGFANEIAMISKKSQFQDPTLFAKQIEERITALEARLAAHYSKRAHIFLLSLKISLYRLREEDELCRKTFAERAELLDAHPGLMNKHRMGLVYFQLARLECEGLQLSSAIENASRSMGYFSPRNRNHHKAAAIKIIALILTGQLEAAEQVITESKAYLGLKSLVDIIPYYTYFDACIAYFRQDYSTVSRLLQDAPHMAQDKHGWNVRQRILEIMVSVDEGEHRLASARIENLRKHIGRHEVGLREQFIFRFLYHLERNSFLFEPFSDKMQADLEEMQAQAPWFVIAEELTRFDLWAESRRIGQDFYPYLCQYIARERDRSAAQTSLEDQG